MENKCCSIDNPHEGPLPFASTGSHWLRTTADLSSSDETHGMTLDELLGNIDAALGITLEDTNADRTARRNQQR